MAALLAGGLLLTFASSALAGPAVRHLYGWQGSQLVPFDIDAAGQVSERADQGVAIAGNFQDLRVGRDARHVYVSMGAGYYSGPPASLRVYAVAADGSLSLQQSTAVGATRLALTPDGTRLFTRLSNGQVGSFPVNADGTLGSAAAASGVSAGDSMAISTDGKTFYAGGYVALDQYAIGADGSLTAQLPTVYLCQAAYLGVTPDARTLDLFCGNPNGNYSFALSAGGGLTQIGARFGSAGGYMYAADPLGRALYQGIYPHLIEQLQRQPDGSLVDFAISPYLVDAPTTIRAVAADPSGRALAIAGETSRLDLYGIAADGSLSPTPATTLTTSAYTYRTLAYAPLQPPVAALSASVSEAGVVTLDASASHAAGSIARYDWSFGDGTSLADGGPRPTHVYPAGGDYRATVTVTDDLGCGTAGTFGGRQSYCAGSPVARTTTSVHVPDAGVVAPTPVAQPGQRAVLARPLAATATPARSGRRVLLTWSAPDGHTPVRYLIAWSTLHSAQGPGDANMHHLRVAGRTSIALRTRPRTTLHLAVYAQAADGTYTRATKTTVRLP